jgi:hypothetical protein
MPGFGRHVFLVAIGITDYSVPRGYPLFLGNDGRAQLPGVFLFANIELRLKTKTGRGHAPNVHLLVCPDDPGQLKAIESKLTVTPDRSWRSVSPAGPALWPRASATLNWSCAGGGIEPPTRGFKPDQEARNDASSFGRSKTEANRVTHG